MQDQSYPQKETLKIIGFPETKLQIAQDFFSSYGGEYQECIFKQGNLFVQFHLSEYIQMKQLSFEEKLCFQKIQDNVYVYQRQHKTWDQDQIGLNNLNEAILSASDKAHGMYGRSLFCQCICGGMSISFQAMCTNNGDFDSTIVCQDCGRITHHGPGTNGIQIEDEGK